MQALNPDHSSEDPSDGLDLELRLSLQCLPLAGPTVWWVSSWHCLCCPWGGGSQKRGTGCRRGGGTGMACSRWDRAHSGGRG